MEEEDDHSTPFFWLESSANVRSRRRSSSWSFFFSSGALVFLLCVTALLLAFFVVPSILSFPGQLFRPNSVKKSWDSLNLVFVLFALVFGFLARNKNCDDEDHSTVSSTASNEVHESNPSIDQTVWYNEYSDRTAYGSSDAGGLRRTYSSYPDLREESPWGTAADDWWQFSDDTQLHAYRCWDQLDHIRRRRSWKRVQEEKEESSDESDHVKTIHVDTLPLVTRQKEVSYASPPSPSAPPPVVKRKPKQTYESIGYKERRKKEQVKNSSEPTISLIPSTAPSGKICKSDINGSDGGANATELHSTEKKKKKQRQRSVDNLETLLQLPQSSSPSAFHKKGKIKKIISISPPPPPPPPLPPVTAALASKTSARKPPSPVRIRSFNSVEENSSSGGESPLTESESPMTRIPPPPPPPPFKMPSWKFVVQGDYVRIGSMDGSHSGSPDIEDSESPRRDISIESGETTTPVDVPFSLSPDVNAKADMFIARFRAGLKIQKTREKHGLGLSNLGLETKPAPIPNNI